MLNRFKKFAKREPALLTDQLYLAISSFESILSINEKERFQTLKYRVRKKPPSRHAPYNVAADLDRGVSDECDDRRAFGPRLLSLLQSVQQFVQQSMALKDDSQSGGELLLACDTWAVVEFFLMSMPREWHGLRTHVDHVSQAFIEIGRSAPQLSLLYAYYADSMDLRKHLREYYTRVVYLCCKVYKHAPFMKMHSEQSYRYHTIVSKNLSKEMSLYAERVQNEVASWTRGKWDPNVCSWQENKHYMLRRASTLDHQALWKYVRKQATTDSFIRRPEYDTWKRSMKSATLVCTGEPGVGKSVILANMVDDLRRLDTTNLVIHFFCAFDDVKTLGSDGIAGSLLRQILDVLPMESFQHLLFDHVLEDGLYKGEFLKRQLAKSDIKRVFLILDGFYACSEEERIRIIRGLRFLQQDLPLLICISTVNYQSQDLVLESLQSVSIMSVTLDVSQARKFLRKELQYCQRTGEIFSSTETDIESDIEAFLSNIKLPSKYPFSYTSNRLTLLYYAKTTKFFHSRPSVESLGEISDLLRRLDQSSPSEETHSILLELMTVAFEPLTLKQLRDVLDINADLQWPISEATPNDAYIFKIAADIPVAIDEELQTAHISEHLDYRFLTGALSPEEPVDLSPAHRRMAWICLACLSSQHSRPSSFHKDTKRKSILSSLSESTVDHDSWSMDSETIAASCSRTSLESETSLESNTSTIRKHTISHTESFFQDYASKYWLWHFVHLSEKDAIPIDLARDILNRKDQELQYPDSSRQTVVQWAWENDYNILLKLLLNAGMHEQAYPILREAAATIDLETIKKFAALYPFSLREIFDDDDNLPTGWSLYDMFFENASGSNPESNNHTSTNSLDSGNRSPLWHAARNGDVAAVERILHAAYADPNTMDVNDMSPLAIAVAYNRLEVVQAFLKWDGINIRALNDDHCTPLQAAERYGFAEIAAELRAFERKTMGSVFDTRVMASLY